MTRVDYIRCQRTWRKILFLICGVWLLAAIISLAPAFGWKDENFESRIVQHGECLLSQDIYYQIFATFTTFYVPLTATLIFYWKIYQVSYICYACFVSEAIDWELRAVLLLLCMFMIILASKRHGHKLISFVVSWRNKQIAYCVSYPQASEQFVCCATRKHKQLEQTTDAIICRNRRCRRYSNCLELGSATA